MGMDKLKRVQAVRKWLEKAEASFDRHKEMSGDLNLLMAQAEMQRLKESDTALARKKKWGLRCGAMLAAAGLVSGMSLLWNVLTPAAEERTGPSVSVTVSAPHEAAVPVQAVVPAEAALPENPAASEEAPAAAIPAAAIPPAPLREERAEPAALRQPAPPVLSQSEIQSVVGEAGRTLRGQS